MFNQNLLKAKAIEKGIQFSSLAKAIGKNEATFYRKLSRDGDFSRFEIQCLTKTLGLSVKERDAIFFS